MVNAQTVRIQCRRIGVTRIELSQTVSKTRAVWNRKDIQVRLDASGSYLSCGRVGDYCYRRLRLAQPQSLVGKEEECLALYDWSTYDSPEIILPLWRLSQTLTI